MKEFDQLPKSIKKAVRYIKQDAPEDQLKLIQKMIENAFEYRDKQTD
ncbi:hypothetical protein ACFSTA_08850 [Ornithinibacillus salinisoli]|uniref:Transcriptional regulator n=1 Tax=Ornithinibacillus salinisoli TaxID=1848459 RepID=A0ABW4VXZ6_9BACI